MKASKTTIQTLLISRTDSIGDVVLTLPLCGWIKEQFPQIKIVFLGRSYTKAIIACCTHVDVFLNWDDLLLLPQKEQISLLKSHGIDAILHVFPKKEIASLAYKASIPIRIGTRGRIYHFLYCNALIGLSRKKSGLHEALLNIRLAQGYFNIHTCKDELSAYYGFSKIPAKGNNPINELPLKEKFNLIIHPKSKGSAREWPMEHYRSLILTLPEKNFNIFITGTHEDGQKMKDWITSLPPHIHDITGKLSLPEFITFINLCDGIVAASTGPLHIAGALGKIALGLYPPIQPMDPLRWAPIGLKADFIVLDKNCNFCRTKPDACLCMQQILPDMVMQKILTFASKKYSAGNKQ